MRHRFILYLFSIFFFSIGVFTLTVLVLYGGAPKIPIWKDLVFGAANVIFGLAMPQFIRRVHHANKFRKIQDYRYAKLGCIVMVFMSLCGMLLDIGSEDTHYLFNSCALAISVLFYFAINYVLKKELKKQTP